MRESRSKQLEPGFELKVQQLPPMKAMRLLHRISKAVAPAFAAAGKGKLDLLDTDLGDLSQAAALLFDRFSEQDLEDVTRALLAESWVTRDGKICETMPVFDAIFGGRLDLVIGAIGFALEVNYGNLMSAIRPLLAARVAEGKSTSLKISESSGQPTA
jgi:hypothetical protein